MLPSIKKKQNVQFLIIQHYTRFLRNFDIHKMSVVRLWESIVLYYFNLRFTGCDMWLSGQVYGEKIEVTSLKEVHFMSARANRPNSFKNLIWCKVHERVIYGNFLVSIMNILLIT